MQVNGLRRSSGKHPVGLSRRGTNLGWGRCLAVVASVVALMAALSSLPSSAATSQKKKPLSLSNVTIESGDDALEGGLFIALDQGIFARYGLNPTYLEITTGGAGEVTALAAGAAQLGFASGSNAIIAAQQGAPFRGLFLTAIGGPQQIAVTSAFATAHNIPSAGSTQKEADAQLLSLKGTHITVAISGITSNSYIWLAAAAHAEGVSYGVGCTTCDINLDSVGSVPNEVTAYDAGKVNALANVPPNTDQPNSVVIQYGKVNPLPKVISSFGMTTISMIQQHPDTVQAFVDAMMYTMQIYRKAHRSTAETDVETMLENYTGSTLPAAIYSTKIQELYFKNPYPDKSDYSQTLSVYSLTSSTPYNLPYSTFISVRFVQAADKLLHLQT
jgi:ABC-type nitrate/sulfonate/bicarbonate transport system substrate-binding protein